ADGSVDDLRRTKSSPVVRKIAAEHGVDISQLQGTGISGRVTKKDILAHVESPSFAAGAGAAASEGKVAPASAGASAGKPAASTALGTPGIPAFAPGENVRIEKMSVMRKKIAEHMVYSMATSPH